MVIGGRRWEKVGGGQTLSGTLERHERRKEEVR